MLPPFIIDQIRRREEEEQRRRSELERPVLELPVGGGPVHVPRPPREEEEAPEERGVVILDLA